MCVQYSDGGGDVAGGMCLGKAVAVRTAGTREHDIRIQYFRAEGAL